MRQAVESTATTADPSDPSALEEGLSRLKQQWAAADAAPRKPKRNTTSLGKGVRRIGNVTEYDFTVIDADGDDPAYDYADDEDGGGGGLDETSVSREARYFDTAQINVRSGDGGAGCCAFLREKFVARGGPAGGNGGNGGSVWVVADEGRNSLTSFRNQVHWKAEGGARGQGKSQHGANAKDLFIPVPLGTIVREKDAEEGAPPLAELLEHGACSQRCGVAEHRCRVVSACARTRARCKTAVTCSMTLQASGHWWCSAATAAAATRRSRRRRTARRRWQRRARPAPRCGCSWSSSSWPTWASSACPTQVRRASARRRAAPHAAPHLHTAAALQASPRY